MTCLARNDRHVFTEDDLLAAAGPAVFGRGEEYVRYVHGLQVRGDEATASIQAKRVYVVRLVWSRRALDGECSCPHNAEGNFCKHLVAVGLAVLGGERPPLVDESAPLRDYLAKLARDELADLVIELAARDESALRLVQARAVAAGSAAVDPAELKQAVSDAMPRGFVDYRASFDAARSVQSALDDLEQLLNAGAADEVRPALERATTRLRKVVLNADDSAGVLGDACQRAAELHARACVEGKPDPVKLARWLVKFRVDSPGWPVVELDMYVGAFDDRALDVYRAAVARQDAAQAGADHYDRFEIDRMLLELADHDGDVDEAIRLLSRDTDHIAYGAIVARLREAGRESEVLEWMDRAVQAGRLSPHFGRASDDFWLAPQDVADTYLQAGRGGDAITVLRESFRRQPGPDTLRQLIAVADKLGAADSERAWALAAAAEQATGFGKGATLVRIALAEHDLVAAWDAAQRFGAGGAWRELAEASAADLPFDAAQLYRPHLDELLRYPDTRAYPEVARTLATMRELYAKVGEDDAFAELLAELRERYRRRTSLIAELDRAGLR
jgi:uncharacterized Zn finger protein